MASAERPRLVPRFARGGWRALFALLTTVNPMATLSTPAATPATTTEADRALILESARAPAERELKTPLRLGLRQLTVQDDWAFVLANLQNPSGQPLDYATTSRAVEAKEGMVSHVVAALLKRKAGQWSVVALSIGPTDPAWLAWSDQYGAPASLFALSD